MGEEGRDRDPRIRGKREGTEIQDKGEEGRDPRRSQEMGVEGRDRDPRRGEREGTEIPGGGRGKGPRSQEGGEEGRDRDPRRWGKRRLYTVTTIMISASRWAAMRAILMFH